jgi:glycine cleavage system aminomethyltransferase T
MRFWGEILTCNKGCATQEKSTKSPVGVFDAANIGNVKVKGPNLASTLFS